MKNKKINGLLFVINVTDNEKLKKDGKKKKKRICGIVVDLPSIK